MAIRKYLFEMLKERYAGNEKFIERLAGYVNTKEDYESLGRFITDVYETGFMRAVDQYKEQFVRMGIKVNIIPEDKPKDPNSKIFQSEKSG